MWYNLLMLPTEMSMIVSLQSLFAAPFAKTFFVFMARWLVMVIAAATLFGYVLESESNHVHRFKELFWSVGLAFVVSMIISVLVSRMRPFVAFPQVISAWIPAPATAYSFPSSHTAVSWAWAFSAVHLNRTGAPLWFTAAFLISFSRMVVGVHYPTDVLMGGIIGYSAYAYVQWGHALLRRHPSV